MKIIFEKLLVREIVHFCICYIICFLFCLKHLKLRLGRKGSLHKPVSMRANEIRGSSVWWATSIPRLSRREQNPRNEIIAGNSFFSIFSHPFSPFHSIERKLPSIFRHGKHFKNHPIILCKENQLNRAFLGKLLKYLEEQEIKPKRPLIKRRNVVPSAKKDTGVQILHSSRLADI